MPFDAIIRGGRILDGTGAPTVAADIAVAGGKIAMVGRVPAAEGAEIIDAEGLFVAPGFIDIHSHSDFTLLLDPRAVSSVQQGVTLEVVGNCGHGCSYVGAPALGKEIIYGYHSDYPITWTTVAEYLDCLDKAAPAVNVATLIPNGQLRLATVGLEDRPAHTDEISRMRNLLRQGLEEGAFGFSTGLEYATEVGASEKEVCELCREVAAFDALYATHTRNRDEGAVGAVEEAVRTASDAGARLQVSHITPRGGRQDTERAIACVESARRRGEDAAFDMHTRVFGTTYLKSILPPWALQGSKSEIARRLRDYATREKMRSFRSPITALGDWSRIVLLDNPAFPQYSRHDFAEIGRMMGKAPIECAYDLLLLEIDEMHRPMVILHCYSEDVLRLTYSHPACSIGSDATALATDGPLASSVFHGAYTWASWFYRRMVRETKSFSPEEAIRKLTALPASRLGLGDRGVIREGACADIAIFDPLTFGETGTTFEPNRSPTGMRHVLVNGAPTMRDGALTGTRHGRVLRARHARRLAAA